MPEGGIIPVLFAAIASMFALLAYVVKWMMTRFERSMDSRDEQIAELVKSIRSTHDLFAHTQREMVIELRALASAQRDMAAALKDFHKEAR